MKETLISLKTAKLAKEKRFNIPVYFHYSETPINDIEILCEPDDPQVGNGWILQDYNDPKWHLKKYSAPTQSLLQKWLREDHNIHIEIEFTDTTTQYHYNYTIINSNERDYCDEDFMDSAKRIYEWNSTFNTYEEALEIGLQEALKLIKQQ